MHNYWDALHIDSPVTNKYILHIFPQSDPGPFHHQFLFTVNYSISEAHNPKSYFVALWSILVIMLRLYSSSFKCHPNSPKPREFQLRFSSKSINALGKKDTGWLSWYMLTHNISQLTPANLTFDLADAVIYFMLVTRYVSVLSDTIHRTHYFQLSQLHNHAPAFYRARWLAKVTRRV